MYFTGNVSLLTQSLVWVYNVNRGMHKLVGGVNRAAVCRRGEGSVFIGNLLSGGLLCEIRPIER